ncbi:hypothetical protein J2850_000007 [Azospirillum picis]|uniref:Transposase n=1 Tax=Azospirillum picis TaxID=488438 RepID=A0ABU0MDX9_9PROT|nr:hypothetical protein [Azospirillum picis]MDQ0531640.1 hypothetical protein [Azospirillum picis]
MVETVFRKINEVRRVATRRDNPGTGSAAGIHLVAAVLATR